MSDDQGTASPPVDSAAEAALLHWALNFPFGVRVLRACGFSDLLYGFWEHRALWGALQRAHDARDWPLFPGDAFEVVVLAEVCRTECSGTHTFAHPGEWPDGCRAPLFLNLIKPYWLDTSGAMHVRRWASEALEPIVWLNRLRACRESRRLIATAQAIADRAWRLDVDGARDVLSIAARRGGHVVRVDIDP